MTKAMAAMVKARAQIILWNDWKAAFFGTIIMQMPLIETAECQTLATDGESLFFNPGYVLELSELERLTGLAHEALHCVSCHFDRMLDKPLIERNVCMDYPINEQLAKMGLPIPKGWLHDPKHYGMSAESLHPVLFPKKQPAEQPQEPEQPGETADTDTGDQPGEPESEQPGQNGSQAGTGEAGEPGEPESGSEQPGDGTGSGDGTGEPGDGTGEAQETGEQPGGSGDQPGGSGGTGEPGDGTGEAQETGEQPGGSGDQPGGSGGTGEPGEAGNGSQAGKAGLGSGEQPGEATEGTAGESGSATAGDKPGLPAGIGENLGPGGILPSPAKSPAEQTELKQKWERIARQAANAAKVRNAGQMPTICGEIVTAFETARIDWRSVLASFIDSRAVCRETWKRPDRRFMGRNFVMPSRERHGIGRLVWLVDVSGSMDHAAFDNVAAEVKSAWAEGRISKLTVVYTNTAIVRVDEYERNDELEFNVPVGGGTDFVAAMNWVCENAEDATAVIFFTDLEVYNFGSEPDCPVLWLQYGNKANARVPFGEIVKLN